MMKLFGVLTSRKAFALALFVVGFTISLLPVPNSHAAVSTPFDYKVDTYTIDGNVPAGGVIGTPVNDDGTVDFTDLFEDGIVGGVVSLGTVTENVGGDGLMHLKDVGAFIPDSTPPLGSITYELSSNTPSNLLSGAGNFRAEYTYVADQPAADQYYGVISQIALKGFSDPDFSTYSIQMIKTGPGFDASFGGLPSGTIGVSFRHMVKVGGTITTNVFTTNVIAPPFATAVTGPVIFRLDWNDTTKEMTASYSLDGGATSFTSFPPGKITFLTGNDFIVVAAFADPLTLDTPVPAVSMPGLTAFLILVAGAALVAWRRRARTMSR